MRGKGRGEQKRGGVCKGGRGRNSPLYKVLLTILYNVYTCTCEYIKVK